MPQPRFDAVDFANLLRARLHHELGKPGEVHWKVVDAAALELKAAFEDRRWSIRRIHDALTEAGVPGAPDRDDPVEGDEAFYNLEARIEALLETLEQPDRTGAAERAFIARRSDVAGSSTRIPAEETVAANAEDVRDTDEYPLQDVVALTAAQVGHEVHEAISRQLENDRAVAAAANAQMESTLRELVDRLEVLEGEVSAGRVAATVGSHAAAAGSAGAGSFGTGGAVMESSNDPTPEEAGRSLHDELLVGGYQKLIDDLGAELATAHQHKQEMAAKVARLELANEALAKQAKPRVRKRRWRRVGSLGLLMLCGLAFTLVEIALFDGRQPTGVVGSRVATWAATTEWAGPVRWLIEERANANLEERLDSAMQRKARVWSWPEAPKPQDQVTKAYEQLDLAYETLDGEVELDDGREALWLRYADALEAEAEINHGVYAGSNMRVVRAVRAWVEGYVPPSP